MVGNYIAAQQDADRAVQLGSKDALATQRQIEELSVPQFWPTIEDFRAATYKVSGPRESIDNLYGQYLSLSVATECLAGRELAFPSFRAFLSQTFLRVQSGEEVAKTSARRVIAEIVSRVEENSQPDCSRPFLYPETPTEATLPIDLVRIMQSIRRINPLFRSGFERAFQESAHPWFNGSAGKTVDELIAEIVGEEAAPTIFLVWFCERSGPCD